MIIYKPNTSRIANSEKYIICRGFKGISSEYLAQLSSVLTQWNSMEGQTINYMFKHIPEPFISRVRDINREIVGYQITSINNAISIIKNKKNNSNDWLQLNLDRQLAKAREWCRKYNIPHR